MNIQTREPPEAPSDAVADLDACWREHRARLLRRARRLARGCPELADNLLSAATLRILEHARRGAAPIRNIEALFQTVLGNLARDHWRWRRRCPEELCGEFGDLGAAAQTTPEQDCSAREELAQALAELRRLSPLCAELFRLRIVEERSYAEISAQLGLSEVAARKRVQVIRQALRSRLVAEKSSAPAHRLPRPASSRSNDLTNRAGSLAH